MGVIAVKVQHINNILQVVEVQDGFKMDKVYKIYNYINPKEVNLCKIIS